ncbi:hypothetical protein BJX65DRAFT_34185 [Aspergillus insuetus]
MYHQCPALKDPSSVYCYGRLLRFCFNENSKLTIWSKIARSDSSNKASNYKAGVLFDIGETTESRKHQGSGESRDHLGQEKRRDSKSARQLSVRLEKTDEKRGIRVYWRQCWRRSSGRKGEDNSEDKKDSCETQAEKLGQVCGHGRPRPRVVVFSAYLVCTSSVRFDPAGPSRCPTQNNSKLSIRSTNICNCSKYVSEPPLTNYSSDAVLKASHLYIVYRCLHRLLL